MRYSLKSLLHTAIVALTVSTVATAEADNKIVPPAAHQAEHTDLIAGQLNLDKRIKDGATEKYMEELFPEEEEPEMDIYSEGWNSNLVNCYGKAVVPDKMTLDVSNFHMPTAPTYMTSPYGYRRRFRRMHKGVDLKVQIGDTIYAAFDGRVRITKFERGGYGYYVVIRHTNDMETVYGHLSRFLVKPDQYVKAGDPIALGGNTGRSTGPHLHFETRYMGYAINPAAIFDFANHTTHTDTYNFTKHTYMNARDYAPNAAAYAAANAQSTKASQRNSASGKGKASYYTVRRGDTLSRIAARHGTTVSKLCRINGLSASSRLSVGKKIRLK